MKLIFIIGLLFYFIWCPNVAPGQDISPQLARELEELTKALKAIHSITDVRNTPQLISEDLSDILYSELRGSRFVNMPSDLESELLRVSALLSQRINNGRTIDSLPSNEVERVRELCYFISRIKPRQHLDAIQKHLFQSVKSIRSRATAQSDEYLMAALEDFSRLVFKEFENPTGEVLSSTQLLDEFLSLRGAIGNASIEIKPQDVRIFEDIIEKSEPSEAIKILEKIESWRVTTRPENMDRITALLGKYDQKTGVKKLYAPTNCKGAIGWAIGAN